MKLRARAFALGTFLLGVVTVPGCSADRRGVVEVPAQPADPAPPPIGVRPARPVDQPPPISGGTLLATRDGRYLVAADPDRDRVWIADVALGQLRHEVRLDAGDEPGRLVEDGAGRVHVALRGSGALLSINVAQGQVLGKRTLCGGPRGVAYEPSTDRLHIACIDGSLITLAAADRSPVRELRLEPDLRDVVVQAGRLYVSVFRSAELLEIGTDGTVASRRKPTAASDGTQTAEPGVAWRTLAMPTGEVAMVHQRASSRALVLTVPGGYYAGASPCSIGIVHSAVSLLGGSPTPSPPLQALALAVDLAVSGDGSQMAVVAAGGSGPGGAVVAQAATTQFLGGATCASVSSTRLIGAVAVAFDGQRRLWVQRREPAALVSPSLGTEIALPGASRASVALNLFHEATGNLAVCASCHPEAGDDGRVWIFDPIGPRRTQHLRGGISGTEPFHWDGDMTSFTHLVNEVLTRRMGGPTVAAADTQGLMRWLDAQPALPIPARLSVSHQAIARGARLFQDPQIGCASCHSGPHLTNNTTVDIGTGGRFQVAGLVGLGLHAPYMHNGCARTLRDRLGPCGGTQHGNAAALSSTEQDDLLAYLESL